MNDFCGIPTSFELQIYSHGQKSQTVPVVNIPPTVAVTSFWPWVYVTLVLVPVPVWFFQEIFERNKEKYYEEAAERKEDR